VSDDIDKSGEVGELTCGGIDHFVMFSADSSSKAAWQVSTEAPRSFMMSSFDSFLAEGFTDRTAIHIYAERGLTLAMWAISSPKVEFHPRA